MLAPNRDAPLPVLVEGTTLDETYAKLIVRVIDSPGKLITPLTLSIGADNYDEMLGGQGVLKTALDYAYGITNRARPKQSHAYSVDTVAFTIFPKRYHDISDSTEEFFDLYKRAYPRLKALNRANSRGLYFERLTMYGDGVKCGGNQLKWFIQSYLSRDGVRKSMYQAAIFDPIRDHSNTARLPFPCLHSLSFLPIGNSLALNAFYPTQQIYRKAYGNYLGLINLGNFMAEEMGLTFCRLNVMVGKAELDTTKGGEILPVLNACRELVEA